MIDSIAKKKGVVRMNEELYTDRIQTQSKMFIIDLKKNNAGYYMKVSEFSNQKKTCIYVPSEGIDDMINSFEKIKHLISQENN